MPHKSHQSLRVGFADVNWVAATAFYTHDGQMSVE